MNVIRISIVITHYPHIRLLTFVICRKLKCYTHTHTHNLNYRKTSQSKIEASCCIPSLNWVIFTQHYFKSVIRCLFFSKLHPNIPCFWISISCGIKEEICVGYRFQYHGIETDQYIDTTYSSW